MPLKLLPTSTKENGVMSMKLYVGNLSYEITEPELKDLFAPHGVVEGVKIITDRYSGVSRGFGFVEMSNRTEGERAITELNGKMIRNREIVVNEARPQRDRGTGTRRPPGGRRRY
jgi:cold-inducible RNA-binding protein